MVAELPGSRSKEEQHVEGAMCPTPNPTPRATHISGTWVQATCSCLRCPTEFSAASPGPLPPYEHSSGHLRVLHVPRPPPCGTKGRLTARCPPAQLGPRLCHHHDCNIRDTLWTPAPGGREGHRAPPGHWVHVLAGSLPRCQGRGCLSCILAPALASGGAEHSGRPQSLAVQPWGSPEAVEGAEGTVRPPPPHPHPFHLPPPHPLPPHPLAAPSLSPSSLPSSSSPPRHTSRPCPQTKREKQEPKKSEYNKFDK